MPEFSLKIVNEKGLHARASAKLVEVVEAFDARAEVSKDGMSASGDSIMGLLMLGASRGTSGRAKTWKRTRQMSSTSGEEKALPAGPVGRGTLFF